VAAAGEDTRLAAILRLSERAASARPAVARSADRIAAVFVGALLVLAAATAVVWFHRDPARVMAVTFAVLAVSCPCALALATPAALAAAAGSLARRGVVLARGDALETLAKITHVVFDKTGTLTEGRLLLAGCTTVDGRTPEQVLMVAAALEARSEHPLARALVAAAPAAGPVVEDARQTAGEGVTARIDGVEVRVGRPEFVALLAGAMPPALMEFAGGRADTLVGLGDERGWHALFALSDALRPGAGRLIADLKALSITPVLLSGDRNASVDAVARTLGIDDAHAQMRPEDKRDRIAALQCTGAVVAMVGDGINDAPALAQADVAVVMNSGTQAAKEAGNMVDLDSNPTKLIEIVEIGKQLLMTRGALTTFSIANDVAKYFAIIPAAFASTYPALDALNVMHLATPQSAILSAVIFNALIIPALIPLALRGVKFRAVGAAQVLRTNMLIYGVGGILLPFVGIKIIDILLVALHLA